jgi:hypothetical protein
VIVYPAKDDGDITQVYSRDDTSIISYLNDILSIYNSKCLGADVLICYVWNDKNIPMVDIWKMTRNSISDDSGFLYDGFTIR